MSTITMVGGGKGGVGKTTVVLAAVDTLLTRGDSVVLVESDDSNPDAYKALNKLITSEICNLDDEAGYIKLGGIIEANPDARIVVNTAARATKGIVTHGGILADVARELGRELVMLWPLNRQRDSIELLKEFLDGADGYAATYACLNTYFGSADKFARYSNSKQKDRVTGTITFPELNDLVADKIIDNRVAFSNADGKLTIAERSALSRFRKAATEALEVVYG
jgi:hypothetical protein